MIWRHRYAACGLSLVSDLPVPGLRSIEDTGPPDVCVSMQGGTALFGHPPFHRESLRYASEECDGSGTPLLTVWQGSDGGHQLRYHDGTEFVVAADAARIDVRWRAPLTAADAAVYLIGPVLGFVMRLRGIVPLHASAVVVEGGAVVFIGDAGAGKSTTAASFAALGYSVLADDIVAIASGEDTLLACPGHPGLSIWPESAEALFGSADALPPLTPTYGKRRLDLDRAHRFHDSSAPIEVIYLLGQRSAARDSVTVSALRPPEALIALVSNTYCNYLLDGRMRASEFDLLSRVVERVPVRGLTFGEGVAALPDLCRKLTAMAPVGVVRRP